MSIQQVSKLLKLFANGPGERQIRSWTEDNITRWAPLVAYAPAWKDGHLGIPQTTLSQPLMLLRAFVVYDLPIGTISLCLATSSTRTAVGRFTTLAQQSGTRCQMNLEIWTVL